MILTRSAVPLLFLTSVVVSAWWNPIPGTTWQWQLQGNLDASYQVQMYDLDMFNTTATIIQQLHAQNAKVICYINVGAYENWRPDASSFPQVVIGNSNGWPGENWLDIRRIDLLGPIMTNRFQMAQSIGCDGVEPDNVDGYENDSGFPLVYDDQITYNKWIAQQVHSLQMSVGLKNDLDQITDLIDDFDWALNEQCFEYQECDTLTPFISASKAVFQTEYNLDVSQFCPEANQMHFSSIKKDLDLDSWVQFCWNQTALNFTF
jgi:hypothetical protein